MPQKRRTPLQPTPLLPQDLKPYLIYAGAALREARTYRNLSLHDLSDLTGIPKHYLSKIENGKLRNFTLLTLSRITYALAHRPTFTERSDANPTDMEYISTSDILAEAGL